ncbi:MAG: ABC transporter ATP-binding protein, partial [Weissella confusa]|nr:ABC transporter ATP-binding protein [Weissella confusa]
MSEEYAVEIEGLTKTFGTQTAVDNVSFNIKRGEVFGLLGPNGAGKTTTFRMLCGLLPVTSGDLRVAGVDVVKSRTAARSNFGYVAQKFSLYGNLSVMENLEFFAGVYGLYSQKKDDRIEAVIKEFRLNDVRDMIAGDLPGGYKQRLSMAAALMHEPKILFLDE